MMQKDAIHELINDKAAAPYDIEGFNEKEERIAYRTITDIRDSGLIDR